MNKGQKVALKHAANAIEGIRPAGGVRLGAVDFETQYLSHDNKGRPFPAKYLADRAGLKYQNHTEAKAQVSEHFGLTPAQVLKLGAVARSTHNIKQRGQRVATFLRKVAEVDGYVGRATA